MKQALGSAIKSLGSRTNLKINDDSSADEESDEATSEFEDEDMGTEGGRSTPQSDDSTDKVPVKQSPEQRAYRAMINQKVDEANEAALEEHIIPGIVNTQAHFNKLDQLKKVKESEAALVIQKFYRGYLGREYFKRQSTKEKQRIEFEYENLNRELKNDTQYNLKTYLAEKKRIREKHGMVDSASDSIAEMIGESSSAGISKARQRQAVSGGVSTQIQNFFNKDSSKTAASAKDPLSLISIFAKRNGVIPEASKSRSIGGTVQQSSSRRERGSSRGRTSK